MKISLSEIRSMARADLAGKWSNAVLLLFIYMLVVIPVNLLVQECVESNGSTFLTIAVKWWFINPLTWGFAIAFLNNSRGSESSFGISKLFDGFRDDSRVTYTLVLESIYLGLWFLLMLIPSGVIVYLAIKYGAFTVTSSLIEPVDMVKLCLCLIPCWGILLIKTFSYAATTYILKDNPELKNNGAIELSMKMMDGHKMDLFFLELSFIGWWLLCILTLGIGLLWLIPYIQASTARFYEQVKAEYEQKNVGYPR